MYRIGIKQITESLTWDSQYTEGMPLGEAARAARLLFLWKHDFQEFKSVVQQKDYDLLMQAALKSSGWKPLSLYVEFMEVAAAASEWG